MDGIYLGHGGCSGFRTKGVRKIEWDQGNPRLPSLSFQHQPSRRGPGPLCGAQAHLAVQDHRSLPLTTHCVPSSPQFREWDSCVPRSQRPRVAVDPFLSRSFSQTPELVNSASFSSHQYCPCLNSDPPQFLFVFSVLQFEPGASCMPGKRSATYLYSQLFL